MENINNFVNTIHHDDETLSTTNEEEIHILIPFMIFSLNPGEEENSSTWGKYKREEALIFDT